MASACERCGRPGPSVQPRRYSRPGVADAAQSAPQPGNFSSSRELRLCAECDSEARQPNSPARRWVEKQLGETL